MNEDREDGWKRQRQKENFLRWLKNKRFLVHNVITAWFPKVQCYFVKCFLRYATIDHL